MLNLERILNQDRLLRAITGLNRKAFETLLGDFTEAYENSRLKPEMERQNKRSSTLERRDGYTQAHHGGVTRKKRVLLLTPARGGRVHDKRQLDEAELVECIPDEVAIEGDLGFQGLQKEFVNIYLPHKKPRGQELSEEQKEENREFSSQRVKCEHAHAGIKPYRAVTDVYRNRIADFDDHLMLNAAGLGHFYLDAA